MKGYGNLALVGRVIGRILIKGIAQFDFSLGFDREAWAALLGHIVALLCLRNL